MAEWTKERHEVAKARLRAVYRNVMLRVEGIAQAELDRNACADLNDAIAEIERLRAGLKEDKDAGLDGKGSE